MSRRIARIRSPSCPPNALHDARPVVLAGGPAEDGRHEPGMDSHRHAQMPSALRGLDGFGHGDELVELAAQLRAGFGGTARRRGLARARLLDERRAQRRRLGRPRVGEEPARHRLGDQQLVVVAKAGDEAALASRPAVAHGAELLEHLDHAQELLPVGAAQATRAPAGAARAARRPLDVAPGWSQRGGRAPGAAVALDGGQRRLRALRALAIDQLGDGRALSWLAPGGAGRASRSRPRARRGERGGAASPRRSA